MVLKPCCPYRSSAKTEATTPTPVLSTLPTTSAGENKSGAKTTELGQEKQG